MGSGQPWIGHIGSIADFKHGSSSLYDRRGMRAVPYWTADNPSNKYGSLTAVSSSFGGGYDLFFPRSFVRIQDLTLAYTLAGTTIQRTQLSNLKIFGSIRNLYSFDQWESWDPESGGSPMPRTFSIGLNLTF